MSQATAQAKQDAYQKKTAPVVGGDVSC